MTTVNMAFHALPLEGAQAAMLTYDVPRSTKMQNPSHMLASLGMFRVNLSVWVGTLPAIGRVPLDKWATLGVRSNVVRFEKEEWERVRALAERALEEELERMVSFMHDQRAKAEAEFALAESLCSAKDVVTARRRLYGLMREGNRRARAAKASMLAFDLFATREDLSRAFDDACAVVSEAFLAARERERVLDYSLAPRAEVAS